MDYLRVNNSSINEVMWQVHDIIDAEDTINKLFNYLQKHKELLDDNEYVNINTIYPKSRPGVMQFLIGRKNYSINIKKSTLIILAFLLDYNFSKGVASLALRLSGFSFQVLQKINAEEKCIIMDILLGNKKNASDFNYNNDECIQNDIKCPYRDEYLCKRTIEIIDNQLKVLMEKQVIQKKNGLFKQMF